MGGSRLSWDGRTWLWQAQRRRGLRRDGRTGNSWRGRSGQRWWRWPDMRGRQRDFRSRRNCRWFGMAGCCRHRGGRGRNCGSQWHMSRRCGRNSGRGNWGRDGCRSGSHGRMDHRRYRGAGPGRRRWWNGSGVRDRRRGHGSDVGGGRSRRHVDRRWCYRRGDRRRHRRVQDRAWRNWDRRSRESGLAAGPG